ncbi:S8 family peptidase [Flavobacterium psychrotolerans]|uniref:Peptidase S8 n=1 Tax=Flavobacterium psychrotolerans TaxID=2169410 RepID=A0A2U1JK85_9FLAO|nr:S8 family peptidase [Flavobacterium psychrotolerans]PWA05566.1 peptidase S8 [Flavobacterium psychrotolerans]
MKLIKNLALTAFAIVTLASCGTSKMISTSAANVDKIPLKISPIKESDLKRWSHLDLMKDTIPGMSVDKAYAELLKNKKGVKVIVGIVDSGVDIDHEDLKSVIWTNSKEVAGNGIDDDKNGYIDDIHGWNFLGNSGNENLEMTRIVKKGDTSLQFYKEAKADYDKQLEDNQGSKQQVDFIFKANKTVSDYLKKENYTIEEVTAITTTDATLNQSKQVMMSIIGQTGPDFNSELKDYKNQVYDMLNYNLNLEFDGRKVVGDNPEDINDKVYGNNIVYGPNKEDALHGTHVAGIIAQVRNNNLGGDGIANNAIIMAVRAVPNGDEYDKDIALGIRYAVDNGAKVINGSFGKSYSPHKQWVYDAIKYAASKDVLIVHAAGNDGHDIDLPENKNYPNDSDDNKTEFANNFITVGALNTTYGSGLVANFSNFGSFNVDVFSPGMKIYATVPNNKYKYEQGTSMASPNVAGVATLIRSYYPTLTAAQVKQILMDSGTPVTSTVILGEKEEKRPFTNASKSGKMVNAYNALLMAEKMATKK